MTPPLGSLLSPTGRPVYQPGPVPADQLAGLLLGAALLEQGFSAEQAADLVRRVALPVERTGERMAERAERHADGVVAARANAGK